MKVPKLRAWKDAKLCMIEPKNINFHFEPVQHLKMFKCFNV